VVVVGDCVCQGSKLARIAKRSVVDGLEDLLQVFVEKDSLVCVLVADVLDVLGQVTEKEDVFLTNLRAGQYLWK